MTQLRRLHGSETTFARAVGKDTKGKIPVVLRSVGIALSFVNPWLGAAVYVLAAAVWFIPDRRFERQIG